MSWWYKVPDYVSRLHNELTDVTLLYFLLYIVVMTIIIMRKRR